MTGQEKSNDLDPVGHADPRYSPYMMGSINDVDSPTHSDFPEKKPSQGSSNPREKESADLDCQPFAS